MLNYLGTKKNKEKKILVVVPKQRITNEEDYGYVFPLGLGYVSSALKKEGYEVDILNLNHNYGKINELLNRKLDSKRYDFVLTVSIITEYSCVRLILDTVKSHKTSPKTILGGLIITSEPEVVFNLLEPDYAIIGEGELTIVELLESINNNNNNNNLKKKFNNLT